MWQWFKNMWQWLKKLIECAIESIRMWIRRLFGIPPFKGHSPCAPKYQPAIWNDCPNPVPLTPPNVPVPSSYCSHDNHKQRNNNCYNYGCNIQNDTYAQPGNSTTGYKPKAINCTEYIKAAISDGLKPVKRCEPCSHCCHKVALVIWPGNDYHWYRQDENGRWSHKPDQGLATDKDSKGNPIDDPEEANRGPYTVFCGYFCVCKNKVQIQ